MAKVAHTSSSKSVIVAGDVCIDVIGVPKPRPGSQKEQTENWRLTGELRTYCCRGGALLLEDMIQAAIGDPDPDAVRGPILEAPRGLRAIAGPRGVDEKHFERLTRDEIIHSVIRAGEFKTTAESDKEDKTIRVAQTHGFSGPATCAPTLKIKMPTPPDAKPFVLVLDDTGNRFRQDETQWVDQIDRRPKLIIYKLHRPLPLERQAGEVKKNPLWTTLMPNYRDQTLVVVSADDLRSAGAAIGRQLSWERTSRDLLWHLIAAQEFKPLADCRWLVVRLGLDGALCWQRTKMGANDRDGAWLIYDPAGIENQFARSFAGEMVGYGSAFTAALVATLDLDQLERSNGNRMPSSLEKGIKAGLQSARRLLELGYGKGGEDPSYPVNAIFHNQKEAYSKFQSVIVLDPQERALPNLTDNWTILESKLPPGDRLFKAAEQLALKRDPPKELNGVPLGTFGKLKTYDRNEIESYRAISNLMEEYLALSEPKRPLCFAVFGPPGSGKTFGVQQVAEAVAGDRVKIEKLTFNLSQFQSPQELAPALHRVRDEVLRGRVPLVFFDEFDSSVGPTRLFWLKYLLSPMEDGEFVEQGVAHPIGKAIFVFAGGIFDSYKDFIDADRNLDDSASRRRPNAESGSSQALTGASNPGDNFRAAKGKDFVSRLRGYLDIRGINHGEGYRGPALLRRAGALRFHLTKKAPRLFDAEETLHIDTRVLRAFLQVPAFEHGMRSMEALVDMSLLSCRDGYEPGCLPSHAQLQLHVIPTQPDTQTGFLDLVESESPWPYDARERIAEEIHKHYLKCREKEGPLDPKKASHKPWAELDKFYRDSNRAQADDIPRKLRLLGLDYMPAKSAAGMAQVNEKDLSAKGWKQKVEAAAIAEHKRWCAERRRQGWTYGEKEDRAAKTHPCMLPWDQIKLDENGNDPRQKDIDSIRALPRYVQAASYVVVNPHRKRSRKRSTTVRRSRSPRAARLKQKTGFKRKRQTTGGRRKKQR
jgi:hypothetical protein